MPAHKLHGYNQLSRYNYDKENLRPKYVSRGDAQGMATRKRVLPRHVVESIRAAQTAAGIMEDSELARRAGIDKGNLSKFLAGKTHDMTASNLLALADALDVSTDWLLRNRAGDMRAPKGASREDKIVDEAIHRGADPIRARQLAAHLDPALSIEAAVEIIAGKRDRTDQLRPIRRRPA